MDVVADTKRFGIHAVNDGLLVAVVNTTLISTTGAYDSNRG